MHFYTSTYFGGPSRISKICFLILLLPTSCRNFHFWRNEDCDGKMRIVDGWALCASAVKYLPLGRPFGGAPACRGPRWTAPGCVEAMVSRHCRGYRSYRSRSHPIIPRGCTLGVPGTPRGRTVPPWCPQRGATLQRRKARSGQFFFRKMIIRGVTRLIEHTR